MHPRTPGNRHSSTGTRSITAWHRDFTIRIHIIVMITLTSDKPPLIGTGFPMKGSIHQESGLSTPKQVASPGDLAPPPPPEIAVKGLCRPIPYDQIGNTY
jgi:hypothetical protein